MSDNNFILHNLHLIAAHISFITAHLCNDIPLFWAINSSIMTSFCIHITDVWQVLQGKLLSWASACSSIHVISGAILDADHNGFRDNDENYDRYEHDLQIFILLFDAAGGLMVLGALLSKHSSTP